MPNLKKYYKNVQVQEKTNQKKHKIKKLKKKFKEKTKVKKEENMNMDFFNKKQALNKKKKRELTIGVKGVGKEDKISPSWTRS
jgi:hypothetical protein